MSAGTKRISNGDEDANDDAAIVDGGPGLVYMPFVVMEDLLDKLKLLNYEEVSLKSISVKEILHKNLVEAKFCIKLPTNSSRM